MGHELEDNEIAEENNGKVKKNVADVMDVSRNGLWW